MTEEVSKKFDPTDKINYQGKELTREEYYNKVVAPNGKAIVSSKEFFDGANNNNTFFDGSVLTNREGTGNKSAWIDGRTNKFTDFDSNKEWGRRSFRIEPGFDARGKDDNSGLLAKGRAGKRQYYTGVDKNTGVVTVYRSSTTGQDDPIGYYKTDGTFTPLQGRDGKNFGSDREIQYFNGELEGFKNADKFVKDEALKIAESEWQAAKLRKEVPPPPSPTELKEGITKEQLEKNNEESGKVDANVIDKNIKDAINGQAQMKARIKYSNLEYPTGITDFVQDKLKITVLQQKPREFGGTLVGNKVKVNQFDLDVSIGFQKTVQSVRIGGDGGSPFIQKDRVFTDRNILGSVVLPIPDGVTDLNAVTYNRGEMNPLQMAGANIALQSLLNTGKLSGGETAADVFKTAAKSGNLPASLANLLTASAIGADANTLLSRTQGTVFNNNLQLLFKSQTLRPFNFQYDLSARDENESQAILKIIRMFKQSMAVQRDNVGIFLGSPDTYRLEFLDATLGTHKFLPVIKECALISFQVNYMPTNSYMTFDDSSMVVYRLQFSFQELDPIFNDDYTAIDSDADDSIGF